MAGIRKTKPRKVKPPLAGVKKGEGGAIFLPVLLESNSRKD